MQEITFFEKHQKESLRAMRWWVPILCVALLIFLVWAAAQPSSLGPQIHMSFLNVIGTVGSLLMAVLGMYGRYLALRTACSAVLDNGTLTFTLVNGQKISTTVLPSALGGYTFKPFFNLSPLSPHDKLVGLRLEDVPSFYVPSKQMESLLLQ